MPVFLALAALTNFVAGGLTTAGLATTTAAATAGANLIVGTTLSLASQKLFAPQVRQSMPDYQAVFNQALAPRLRGYGRVKVGGPRAFFDSKDGLLYQIILLHCGEIDEIEEYWIGDKRVTLDSVGRVEQSPFVNRDNGRHFVTIRSRVGERDQSAYGQMVADWPGKWTEDHRLNGIANILAVMKSPSAKKFSRVFPESHNTPFRTVFRASKPIDPRSGARKWSSNPGLCIRDYLLHPDGYRLEADDIDDASFADFADTCAERVPLKGGGTRPRYTLHGLYSFEDPAIDTLGRMRATCDAELWETPEGKIAIRGGEWRSPTVTITDRDILSYDLQQGADRFTTFNELKITYTSPRHDYQPQEAARWIDKADQARRGRIVSEFAVDMVDNSPQARQLAQIYRAKENPLWFGSITTNLVGLRARYKRLIRLVIAELDIDGPFLVESHGHAADLTSCTIELRWLGPEAYAPVEEEDEAPEAADTSPSGDIPIPLGLSLGVDRRQRPVVVATVAAPARDDLDLEAEIIRSGTSSWEAMTVAQDSLKAISAPVDEGATYSVHTRWLAPGGSAGDWSAEVSIAVTADLTAPAAPTGLARASSASGTVSLAWTNPAANFARAKVYRGSTTTFAAATLIGTVFGVAGDTSSYLDAPVAGTWRYWVAAANSSNIAGAPAGPITVTL